MINLNSNFSKRIIQAFCYKEVPRSLPGGSAMIEIEQRCIAIHTYILTLPGAALL